MRGKFKFYKNEKTNEKDKSNFNTITTTMEGND